MALLGRMGGKAGGVLAIGVLDLAAALADFGVIMVTQNGKEPSLEVGALLKAVDVGPGLDQGFLDEIVGAVGLAAQGYGKGPERAYRSKKFLAEARRNRHFLWLSSSFVKSSTMRSGTGAAATSS